MSQESTDSQNISQSAVALLMTNCWLSGDGLSIRMLITFWSRCQSSIYRYLTTDAFTAREPMLTCCERKNDLTGNQMLHNLLPKTSKVLHTIRWTCTQFRTPLVSFLQNQNWKHFYWKSLDITSNLELLFSATIRQLKQTVSYFADMSRIEC